MICSAQFGEQQLLSNFHNYMELTLEKFKKTMSTHFLLARYDIENRGTWNLFHIRVFDAAEDPANTCNCDYSFDRYAFLHQVLQKINVR